MGGTCSRIVSVKTSKAFNNRIHPSTSPLDNGSLKVEGNQVKPISVDDLEDKNLDRVTTEEQTDDEPSDIFSRGDHNGEISKVIEVNIKSIGRYNSLQSKLEGGDNEIKDPSADKTQNMSPQSGENENLDNSYDLNDNSFNGSPCETQTKYKIDIDIDSNCDCDGTDDSGVPLAPRESAMRIEVRNEMDEKQDEVEGGFDSVAQDSLFFLPLDGDQQKPPTANRFPERLNRSRKPPLTYSERMLLADCNRFQQLDKKREFAVRRNRSISRIGKLPKINGESSEENSDKTNNYLKD